MRWGVGGNERLLRPARKGSGQRDLITAVAMPTISAGEFVQATGSWVNDRTHGVQFRARC